TICMKTPRHSRDASRCHCTTFLLVSNMQLKFCRMARTSGKDLHISIPNPSTMQEPNSPNKRVRCTPKAQNKMHKAMAQLTTDAAPLCRDLQFNLGAGSRSILPGSSPLTRAQNFQNMT